MGRPKGVKDSKLRSTLSYGQARKVEELIRDVWKRGQYVPGASDQSVAHQASEQLGFTVRYTNVAHIRRELGMHVRGGQTWCTKESITRLEALLNTTDQVFVARGSKGGLYITSMKNHMAARARMAKVKPWLKSPSGVPNGATVGVSEA